MKNNGFKKRKIIMPIIMASLITTLGVGGLNYARAETPSTSVAPYNVTGNKHGFGAGKGQGAAGIITAIDGTTITINTKSGKKYVVDASTANFLKTPTFVPGAKRSSPTPITISDIKIGDTIMIKGTISGTTIKALTVTDGKKIEKNKLKNNKMTNKNKSWKN